MNYSEKLQSLKNRRSISDDIKKQYIFDSSINRQINESYLSLGESDPVKYAIGIMQALPKRYTEICFEEGERVAASLKSSLKNEIGELTHEFQGSVPLDIHIKGVSDVDVLIFHPYLIAQVPRVNDSNYTTINDGLSMLDRMRNLRASSEVSLKKNYPAAFVDTTKAKAINIKGGSLQREVDIVPAHWYDTIEYQRYGKLMDREVRIYDKDNHQTIANLPFKHMSKINDRDAYYNGNLKRVCRMLKNLKEDSSSDRYELLEHLSSYDIASIAFHMGDELNCSEYFELSLIIKVRDYLIEISSNNCQKGKTLITPDESRVIIDSSEKGYALMALAIEVSGLFDAVSNALGVENDELTARRHINNKALFL